MDQPTNPPNSTGQPQRSHRRPNLAQHAIRPGDEYVLKYDPADCYWVGGEFGKDQLDEWLKMGTLLDGTVFKYKEQLWIVYQKRLLVFLPSCASVIQDGQRVILATLMPQAAARLAYMGVLSPVWQCC